MSSAGYAAERAVTVRLVKSIRMQEAMRVEELKFDKDIADALKEARAYLLELRGRHG